MPFDPLQLTSAASLNRVPIGDLPTFAVDPQAHGKTAYDLLSRQALEDAITEHADALKLTNEQPDPARLLPAFDRCFEADDPGIRSTAETITAGFGNRLGYLVATLKRGDPLSRRARVEWDDTYWEHWAQVRQIWLGGGLASGQLGARLGQHSMSVLAQAGVTECAIAVAAHPALLPLIGAARSQPPTASAALVCDFGQSAVKRAFATYQAGTLVMLHVLPTLPLDWTTLQPTGTSASDHAHRLAHMIGDLLADSWKAGLQDGVPLAPALTISLAAYLQNNHPLPGQGGPYGGLSLIAGNVGHWLEHTISEQLGQQIGVRLIHDGTAAATTYAGEPHTAVIMLGTALGSGFPPASAGMRPLARNLRVVRPK